MVQNRARQMLCALTVGLLFVASFAFAVSAITIVDHGFATTVPSRDSGTGIVGGYIDLKNNSASVELVHVSAVFFDEDG